jgi:hypothetical protein
VSRPPDHDDPATGAVVAYPWVCPYCTNGSWDDGVPCTNCSGRGLTDDVSAIDPDKRQLAPRPPAVLPAPCSDCRYPAGATAGEPYWCHQNMPSGANGVMSPAAWAGGMPLGYNLCGRWWSDITGQPALPAPPDA